ncbi:hypothetical protein B4N89_41995 [Embleya scabrispora]|uniref:PGM1 C-terminal domain-containing protein n=1 Tax=Embleya scabrispora TaxID=159449 RepID=A0A1T3NKA1_9ACTN|nr:peptide ligase PGM1-related protein [Embleya scabrispora]OPC77135.1 hypothetical protein B4N89_41995 [Embleya scabrispora]
MPQDPLIRRIDRFEAHVASRPGLRLRVACPSQEFSELEMQQGLGRWLSCVRGLWESLGVASRPDLAMLMFQAPPVPASVERYLLALRPAEGRNSVADRLLRHALIGLPDASDRHLSEKLLERPELLDRVGALISRARARGQVVEPLSCYQASTRMDEVAERIGVERGETPSRTLTWGSKAGGRKVFRAGGLAHAPGGYEPVHDMAALARQATELVRVHGTKRWLVKINDGYGSGHGLAAFTPADARYRTVLTALRQLQPLTENISRDRFLESLTAEGAIIEQYLPTPPRGEKRSPSTLLYLHHSADGGFDLQFLGTHEQVLGADLQYLGCRFPASHEYRGTLVDMSLTVGKELGSVGVRGHVGIDFIARKAADGRWDVHAIELNLRQTGTTHPHRTVRALLPGTWPEDGLLTHRGSVVHYTGTDGLISPAYRGLTPDSLIEELRHRPGLAFDATSGRGVVPHFWTALRPYGKIGATFIGTSREECDVLQREFTDLLDGMAGCAPAARG